MNVQSHLQMGELSADASKVESCVVSRRVSNNKLRAPLPSVSKPINDNSSDDDGVKTPGVRGKGSSREGDGSNDSQRSRDSDGLIVNPTIPKMNE